MKFTNELQLPEFEILSKKELDEILYYEVQPVDSPKVCPNCGSANIVKNGGANRFVRDMPLYGKAVAITIYSNRYMCKSCNQTFSPSFESVSDRGKITTRLRNDIKKHCLSESITKISGETGLSDATISRITDEAILEKESSWKYYTPEILGLTEILLGKKQRTLCVDVKRQGVIDVLEESNKKTIYDYLTSKIDSKDIKMIVIDFNNPYREAAYKACSGVGVVIDKFYTLREIIKATSKELKRLNKSFLRWVILKNSSGLSLPEVKELSDSFDSYPGLKELYDIKEQLCAIYNYETRGEAEDAFAKIARFLPSGYIYFKELIDKIKDFEEEVFSFFENPYSSSSIQNAAKLAIKIEKQGFGYSFKNLRARILFSQTPKKAKKVIRKPIYKQGDSGSSFKFIMGFENEIVGYKEAEQPLGYYIEIKKLLDAGL